MGRTTAHAHELLELKRANARLAGELAAAKRRSEIVDKRTAGLRLRLKAVEHKAEECRKETLVALKEATRAVDRDAWMSKALEYSKACDFWRQKAEALVLALDYLKSDYRWFNGELPFEINEQSLSKFSRVGCYNIGRAIAAKDYTATINALGDVDAIHARVIAKVKADALDHCHQSICAAAIQCEAVGEKFAWSDASLAVHEQAEKCRQTAKEDMPRELFPCPICAGNVNAIAERDRRIAALEVAIKLAYEHLSDDSYRPASAMNELGRVLSGGTALLDAMLQRVAEATARKIARLACHTVTLQREQYGSSEEALCVLVTTVHDFADAIRDGREQVPDGK